MGEVMECVAGTSAIAWICPAGCMVQLGQLSTIALDPHGSGNLALRVDGERFSLAQYVHMRMMHGMEHGDDCDD